MPNGKIQPEFVTRLQEVGAWLAKNGEAVYGTRGGPIAPHPWGATTMKGNRVYVHVLDLPDQALLLSALPSAVRSARLLDGGKAVEFKTTDSGVILTLPTAARDPIDTIVVLELEPKAAR
jgi:alpha-L-fucosidase